MSQFDEPDKVDFKGTDEHFETAVAGGGGLVTFDVSSTGNGHEGPISRFNHLSSIQAVKKFWRLYLWGLSVTIAGM